MANQTYVFETLRSDCEETLEILGRYVDRNKIKVKDVSINLCRDTWLAKFTVSCDADIYAMLRSELEKDWLLVGEDLA